MLAIILILASSILLLFILCKERILQDSSTRCTVRVVLGYYSPEVAVLYCRVVLWYYSTAVLQYQMHCEAGSVVLQYCSTRCTVRAVVW